MTKNELFSTIKTKLAEFGLPRIIIALFLLVLFIVAPFVDSNISFWVAVEAVLGDFSFPQQV